MKHAPDPTLLAPLNILKVWAEGFGIQLTDDQRYEINNIHTAYNRYAHLPYEAITHNLKGLVSDSYYEALKQILPSAVQSLINKLHQTCFFTMTPKEVEDFIWGELYAIEFFEAYTYLHMRESYLPSVLRMMGSDEARHATAVALEVLDEDITWCKFKATLDKAAIDRLWRWRTSELASITKLKELLDSHVLSKETQQKYFTILLHARFLDSLKPKPKEKGNSESEEENESKPKSPSELLFEGIRSRHMNLDWRIFLPLKQTRTDDDKEQCLWAYDLLKILQLAKQDFDKGYIANACKRYSKLLKLSACFHPDEQEKLISLALMVASMKGKNGDAPLLKKAKNLAIVYGLEQPHDHISERPIRVYKQLNDFVKQYEIEQWQRDCKQLFPNAKVDYSKVRPEVMIAGFEEQEFTVANRKSRIGDSEFRLEQLSQAILQRDYESTEKLLAQTNRLDFGTLERGHSPLIIALQTYKQSKSNADAKIIALLFARLAATRVATNKIVGTRTDKRKLTPLGLAIECNRPDFVEQLLALGASANQRLSERFVLPLQYAEEMFLEYQAFGSEAELDAATQVIKTLVENGANHEVESV
ncbi:ankyrin repeat domain-containing protein [Pseudidiomarina halophila]|uniref:Ankyrin repeat domain-containing protein n=1 Tax=Pseudidiomarina halophila TaxID=1449799 RepID=A0A432XYY2_9GAMM|nr:ankyrin repeat domain-containing protein [Pseudidiomarina halophila]RUO53929.1 hypothetical protein CWI69_00365 [Pseudidiomarina halophila]